MATSLSKAHRRIALEEAKKEALRQLKQTVNNGLALQMELVMALVLHDKFGFGKKRLTDAINGFEELWDSMNQNYLTLEDVIEVVQKEIGLEFEGEKELLEIITGEKSQVVKLEKEDA